MELFQIQNTIFRFLIVCVFMVDNSFESKANDMKIIRKDPIDVFLEGYDESSPPPGGATAVELGIYINSFFAVSEQTMDYSLSVYLRQQWIDSRLVNFPGNFKGRQKIKLPDGIWTKIWTPDVFFRNEKKAAFHKVTTPNRLVFLRQTGQLWYVIKITTTLSCPMKLEKFPFDTQKCHMMFESFGYTMDDVIFHWLPSPVEYESNLELPQFRLVKHTLQDCSQNYTTGAYPCLDIQFIIQRDIGYYMIQLYIPSVLIVILSWVSFWLNVDAAPARVSIGLLTVLATTTMSTGARDQLPRVSYIKAIDVWMASCLVFVFISLLEYAAVSVFSRRPYRHTTTVIATRAVRTRPPGQSPGRSGLAGPPEYGLSSHEPQRSCHGKPAQCCGERYIKQPETGRANGFAERDLGPSKLGRHGGRTQNKDQIEPTNNSVAQNEIQHVLEARLVSRQSDVTDDVTTIMSSSTTCRPIEDHRLAEKVDTVSQIIFPVTFVIFNVIYWNVYIFLL